MDGKRRLTVTEVLTIIGVAGSILGAIVVFAARSSDRIAIIEEKLKVLESAELVTARLDAQRAAIDKLDTRVHDLEAK